MDCRLRLLVGLTVAGLLLSLCSSFVAGQDNMSPDAATILQRYRQSLSWTESVSMKIDINVVPTGYDDKVPYGVTLLFRYDHGRAEWHGSIFPYDKNGKADPNFTHTIDEVFANGGYTDFSRPVKEPLRRAFISKDVNEHLQRMLDDQGMGGPLWARVYGNDNKNIADLLAESANLTMRQETIEAAACYVLEGTSKYGRVSAWIAPQKGYSALKWSIEKRKDIDLLGDKPSSMDFWSAVFDSVKFQEINGRFVPVAGVFVSTKVPSKEIGKFVAREEYTISDIQLNPNFDSAGAFKIDLPTGTRIYLEEAPGIRYKWQDSKVVADVDRLTFDQIDKTIDGFKQQQ